MLRFLCVATLRGKYFKKSVDKYIILWYYIQRSARDSKNSVGVNCGEGPPVPIPNTAVKLTIAEDTWVATPGKK